MPWQVGASSHPIHLTIVCRNIHTKHIERTPETLQQNLMLAERATWCTHSSSLLCVVSQPTSARTLETLISFHKSRICAFCTSAKECQVNLFWPSTNILLSNNRPTSPEAHRGKASLWLASPPNPQAMRVTLV